MPNKEDFETEDRPSATSSWIALAAAVGVTATALIIAKRLRSKSVKAHVEDLFSLCNVCDEAVKALDDRLSFANG